MAETAFYQHRLPGINRAPSTNLFLITTRLLRGGVSPRQNEPSSEKRLTQELLKVPHRTTQRLLGRQQQKSLRDG